VTELPTIEVLQDYDGYFETVVERWLVDKARSGAPFKHSRVSVSAGPYRMHAVSTEERDGGTAIHLDFYSPLRTGFGGLTAGDVEAIKDLL
jgi:hypothetical protein